MKTTVVHQSCDGAAPQAAVAKEVFVNVNSCGRSNTAKGCVTVSRSVIEICGVAVEDSNVWHGSKGLNYAIFVYTTI